MISKIPYLSHRDNNTRKVLLYCLGFFFILQFLVKNAEVSDVGKYLIEIVLLWCLTRGVYRPAVVNSIGIKAPIAIAVLMFLELAVTSVFNAVSFGNIIVGLLGHYLGFFVFFVAIYVFTIDDYKKLFRLFYYYQFVNLGCSLYQYVVLGYYQDLNNGAFTGGATQDFFCGLLIVYYYSSYIRKTESFNKCAFILISSVIIAILQEEKFILAEIAIVVLYQAIVGKKNIRNILVISLFISAIPVIVSKMGEINGEYASMSLSSTQNIADNLTTEGAGYGFPRIGSLPLITAAFFQDAQDILLGFGCGACENTNLSIADKTFIDRYRDLNYFQYPIQLTYLQTGLIGVCLYVGFFVTLLIYNIIKRKQTGYKFRFIYDIAIMINIICVALIWYNQTLKWYYAIMPFLFLALGPVCTRQMKNNEL